MTALYCDAYTLGARYLIESIVSISSPFSDDTSVVTKEIPLVILFPLLSLIFPEKVKFADPFADFPLVTI